MDTPGTVAPFCDPAVLLRMLLLVAYAYNLSERQAQPVANGGLSIRRFLRLATDEPPPHDSVVTAFKRGPLQTRKLGIS